MKGPPRFADYLSAREIATIRALGFRAIRLFIDARYLYHPEHPGRPDPTVLAHLDAALGRLIAHDLGVVIVPNALSRRLEHDSAYREGFIRSWGALAEHLRERDPDRLFLEVVTNRSSRAGLANGRISRAVRLPRFAATPPLPDPNVIYTFHFYEPMTFMHQGASWVEQASWREKPVPRELGALQVGGHCTDR